MAIRVAINGFGRIGRNVFRVFEQKKQFEVVGVNDLSNAETLGYLLRYDSVFGRFPGTVEVQEGAFIVNGRTVKVTAERDPANLPWKELGVDFVIESTGVFRDRVSLEKHLAAGAPKVLLTVPSKDPIDATIVMGVNQGTLKPEHKLISNASCTTNCLAPLAKIINDTFGIENGLMTTCHAYTNDQVILDQIHSDPRRARAAAINIIPTTTGAAKAVGQVIPELNGRLHGMALRVPVYDGSVVDLTVNLKKGVTVADLNAAVRNAAEGDSKGIVEYQPDPIVSTDVIGNPHSCVFDAGSTMMLGDRFAKLIAWYDNEWGYSNRVVDLIELATHLK